MDAQTITPLGASVADQDSPPTGTSGSMARRRRRVSWRNVARRLASAAVLVVAVLAVGALALQVGHAHTSLVSAVLVLLLVLLVAALRRQWRHWPMVVDVPVTASFSRWDRVGQSVVIPGSIAVRTVWLLGLGTFGIIGFARGLLKVGSPASQVGAGLVLGVGLVIGVGSMFSRRARLRLSGAGTSLSDAAQQVAIIAVFAAAAFAFLTEELARHGLVELTAADGSGVVVRTPDPDSLYWFYGWHLLDALPASPLSTLKINAPYDYTQSRVGVLLMVYTLLVVTPFISLVNEVVRQRRHRVAPVVASSAKRPAPF